MGIMDRPAGRTSVVSVAGFTIGMLVAIGSLAAGVVSIGAANARATARATGTVGELYGDDSVSAMGVAWADADGAEHVTLVQTGSDTPDTLGSQFTIRYDPADPAGLVFPAEGEEFPPPGDGSRYLLLALMVVLPVPLLLLGARLLLNLRAARAPESRWRAGAVLLTYGPPYVRWFAGYLELVPEPGGEEPVDIYVQRVYWDSALDRIAPGHSIHRGDPVSVRLGAKPFRRAVVTLHDGTRLWPAGRLRRSSPWGWNEKPRPVLAPTRLFPWGLFAAITVMAGIEVVAWPGFGFAVPTAALIFALVFYMWGWYGGEVICGDGYEPDEWRRMIQTRRGSSPRRTRRKKTPRQNRPH
jgi:hypothetical protein